MRLQYIVLRYWNLDFDSTKQHFLILVQQKAFIISRTTGFVCSAEVLKSYKTSTIWPVLWVSTVHIFISIISIHCYFVGVDPVAVLRWTIVKTLIKSMFAFIKAGHVYRKRGGMFTFDIHTRFANAFARVRFSVSSYGKMNRPHGRAVSTPDFGSWVSCFKFRWRRDSFRT